MTLTTAFGIPLRLHASFLVLGGGLLAWRALSEGGMAAVELAGFLGLLFGSVLLHELGHALVARRHGIETRSITLHPLGGVAALSAEPRSPGAEAAIALAGPAVNLALAGLGALAYGAALPLAGWFVAMNLGMAVFNLLPAWPMDGGRVLRAALTGRMGRPAATRMALDLSQVLAWGLVLAGLRFGFNLSLIGGFLLLAVRSERRRPPQVGGSPPQASTAASHALSVPDPRWAHPRA